jgi:hypothetical protein
MIGTSEKQAEEARRKLQKEIFHLEQEIKSGKKPLKKREVKKKAKKSVIVSKEKPKSQTNSGLEQEAK